MYSPYKPALMPVRDIIQNFARMGTFRRFTGGEGQMAALSPLDYVNNGAPGMFMVNHPGNASTDLRAGGATAFMLLSPSLIL